MNKAKRQLIIALLIKLGYEVKDLFYSNRLNHYYHITKDDVKFSVLVNKTAVLFSFNEPSGQQVCNYGLLLANGGNIAHNKDHEHYKTLVDLAWEIKDLLKIDTPTIIL